MMLSDQQVSDQSLKEYLDQKVQLYNHRSFIENDPISIPKQYHLQQDIEITAFWTAMLAWGQRKTIISKSQELFSLMDGKPYDFIRNHSEKDRKSLLHFKHRTFQPSDTLYFAIRLQRFYQEHESLESAFVINQGSNDFSLEKSLINFREQFFDNDQYLDRTKKHIATPAKKSACKRLNMFLRWMVRKDKNDVDFGIWKNIPKAKLHIPLDVHVHRVALRLGLTQRKQSDWNTVLEITSRLSEFDPKDPAKYDYALFGIGVIDDKRKLPTE